MGCRVVWIEANRLPGLIVDDCWRWSTGGVSADDGTFFAGKNLIVAKVWVRDWLLQLRLLLRPFLENWVQGFCLQGAFERDYIRPVLIVKLGEIAIQSKILTIDNCIPSLAGHFCGNCPSLIYYFLLMVILAVQFTSLADVQRLIVDPHWKFIAFTSAN